MNDTSGFYKLDGQLLYGPNFVVSAEYELYKEKFSTYQYPVQGWYWFDSEVQAKEFWNIVEIDTMINAQE